MCADAGGRQLVGTLVLVVEDNEVNLKLVRDVLEHQGYGVIAARNGEEGVKCAKNHRPALVLMDLQLPRMDGLRATREIRRDPLIGQIPVVAVTGFAMASDREKAREAGCTDFLSKPISIHALLDMVRRYAGPAAG